MNRKIYDQRRTPHGLAAGLNFSFMSLAEVFGTQGKDVVALIGDIVPKLTGQTIDYDRQQYEDLRSSYPDKANKILWLEILGRLYVASAGTIVRTHQWIQAVIICYERNSYLGFCGTLRGLIESVADSMHALEGIAPQLANHHKKIMRVLAPDLKDELSVPHEIERRLIHFAYARHIVKGEQVPEGHRTLQTREYIDTLKRFDKRLDQLYSKLCEVAHPASSSVDWMLATEPDEALWRITFINQTKSGDCIVQILDNNQEALASLLMAGFNYALINLKLLKLFAISDFSLEWTDTVNLSSIKQWRDIEQKIRG